MLNHVVVVLSYSHVAKYTVLHPVVLARLAHPLCRLSVILLTVYEFEDAETSTLSPVLSWMFLNNDIRKVIYFMSSIVQVSQSLRANSSLVFY